MLPLLVVVVVVVLLVVVVDLLCAAPNPQSFSYLRFSGHRDMQIGNYLALLFCTKADCSHRIEHDNLDKETYHTCCTYHCLHSSGNGHTSAMGLEEGLRKSTFGFAHLSS